MPHLDAGREPSRRCCGAPDPRRSPRPEIALSSRAGVDADLHHPPIAALPQFRQQYRPAVKGVAVAGFGYRAQIQRIDVFGALGHWPSMTESAPTTAVPRRDGAAGSHGTSIEADRKRRNLLRPRPPPTTGRRTGELIDIRPREWVTLALQPRLPAPPEFVHNPIHGWSPRLARSLDLDRAPNSSATQRQAWPIEGRRMTVVLKRGETRYERLFDTRIGRNPYFQRSANQIHLDVDAFGGPARRSEIQFDRAHAATHRNAPRRFPHTAALSRRKNTIEYQRCIS